jgi:hypothetical protein
MTRTLAKLIVRFLLCLLVPAFACGCQSNLRTGWNSKGDAGGTDLLDTTSSNGGTGGAGAGGTSDSGAVSDPGNPSAESIESFCRSFVIHYVNAATTCLTGSSLAYASMTEGDPDAVCLRLVRSVRAGLSRYDRQRGTACLAALASMGSFPLSACDDLSATPFNGLDCRTSITPAVSAGGTCSIIYPDFLWNNECMDGTYCSGGSQTYACSGTCIAFLELGAACTLDGQKCRPDTSCNVPLSSPKSTIGQCVADVSAGSACKGPNGPACASGLKCIGGSSTVAGICAKPASSGSCTSHGDCASPNLCVGATGQKTCVAPKANGASCTPGLRECFTMSACNSQGVCDAHLGIEGETCGTIKGEMFLCNTGFYCDGPIGDAGVCRKDKKAGEACTGTVMGECLGAGYQTHCDTSTSTCVSCDGT